MSSSGSEKFHEIDENHRNKLRQWDLGPFSVCLECIDERADDDDDSELKRAGGRADEGGRDERTANDSAAASCLPLSIPSEFVPSLSAFYCLFTASLAPKMPSDCACLFMYRQDA